MPIPEDTKIQRNAELWKDGELQQTECIIIHVPCPGKHIRMQVADSVDDEYNVVLHSKSDDHDGGFIVLYLPLNNRIYYLESNKRYVRLFRLFPSLRKTYLD